MTLSLPLPLYAAGRHHGDRGGYRTEQRDRRGHDRGKRHHGDRYGHDRGHGHGHGYDRTPPGPPRAPRAPRHPHAYCPPAPPCHGYRYVPTGWYRPPRPPHYRPRYCAPSFGSILGITLGMAFDASLSALVNNGYTVSGYGNGMVNLTNVYNLNYMWPDATLYYDNGYFAGGTFVDYAAYNDMARYNNVYAYLTGRYGMPVSVANNGVNLSGTWFGDDGRFVTLSYSLSGGHYLTILTYGR